MLWIYHDPIRDSRKVSDFDVKNWRPGLREVFQRAMAADALAETILTSLGSGGSFPHALDAADEKTCARILIHFLWNWADLLGVRPDLRHCSSCACEAPRDGVLWYDTREDALLCRNCTAGEGITVGPGARLWLGAVENLEPQALGRISLDEVSLHQAKALVTAILTGALGKRLTTWDNV
jgi:DNA repair protein RecO (recombination protein O)